MDDMFKILVCVIKDEPINIQRRVTKITKREKDNRERLEKLELTILLEKRIRGDLTETFKIINGISNYGRDCFLIFLLKLEIYCPVRFQKLSLLTN